MNKSILLLALSLGACASPYKVCTSLDENPYGLDEDALRERDEDRAAENAMAIYAEKFKGKMSKEEFFKNVVVPATVIHWKRYGSLDACMAAVDGERAANWAALNQGLQNGVEQHQAIQRESIRNNQSVIYRAPEKQSVTCNTFCFTPENCQTKCE